MRETEKAFSRDRVAAAFTAFSEFLSHSCCRRCEVLELCLNRLRDDLQDHDAPSSEELLRALRRTVPFPASHTPEECVRCGPAEVLMAYLTPGGEIPLPKRSDQVVDVNQ